MTADKHTIRTQCLAARQKLAAGYRHISSRVVISHVLSLITQGQSVAGYRAIRGELDISTLMKVLAEKNHPLCLPVIEAETLVFRKWQPGQPLVKGKFDVEVPLETAPGMDPTVVLVPLVAFDKEGNRLGYGAGYYDRVIAALRKKNRNTHMIGLAFSSQQVERIPVEEFDQKLDVVVTETGIISFI